ncbi:hypothetical protein NKH18_04785 [Streptomyces sp. M10(2022)]
MGEELPIATIGEWLGLPAADWPRLRELTHDQVFTQELLPSASQLGASDAATAELRTYFTALVSDRRAHPARTPCPVGYRRGTPSNPTATKPMSRSITWSCSSSWLLWKPPRHC